MTFLMLKLYTKNLCNTHRLNIHCTSLSAFSMFKNSSTFLSMREGDWKSNLLLQINQSQIYDNLFYAYDSMTVCSDWLLSGHYFLVMTGHY